METALGRFGHHPDPAIDFEVEVDSLGGEIRNRKLGFETGTPSLEELTARVARAMDFQVGGDPSAMEAKDTLRAMEKELRALNRDSLVSPPIAAPDFYSAASKLLAAFDELQSTTTAERIITGRSDAKLRKASNEAIAELRAAIAKAEASNA